MKLLALLSNLRDSGRHPVFLRVMGALIVKWVILPVVAILLALGILLTVALVSPKSIAGYALINTGAAWTICDNSQRIIKGALNQYTLEQRPPDGAKVSLNTLLMDYLKGGTDYLTRLKARFCPMGGTYPETLIVGISSRPDVSLCSLGGPEAHIRITRVSFLRQLAVTTASVGAVLAAVRILSGRRNGKSEAVTS